MAIVRALERMAGAARVLIVLSEPEAAAAAEAVRQGALGVVTRPISLEGVLAEVCHQMRHWNGFGKSTFAQVPATGPLAGLWCFAWAQGAIWGAVPSRRMYRCRVS